jgi:hypothetical protein
MRVYEIEGRKLTGRYTDEESARRQVMPSKGSREHADAQLHEEDDVDDIDATGSARAAAGGVVTRSRTRAARAREDRINAAIIAFATALDEVKKALEGKPAGTAAPAMQSQAASEAYSAIVAAADRPMHPDALYQVDGDVRDPAVICRERALTHFNVTGRVGELLKRITSTGMGDVSDPEVQAGLLSNYNVRFLRDVGVQMHEIRQELEHEEIGEGQEYTMQSNMDNVIPGQFDKHRVQEEMCREAERRAAAARNNRIRTTHASLFAGSTAVQIDPITEETFGRAFAKLKSDKAAGPDNILANDFLNISKEARMAVLRIANHIVAGLVHRVDGLWAAMSSVNLFAINKDSSDKANVRGIAVGNMMLKVVSLCMLLRHAAGMQRATMNNMGNGQAGGADAFARAGGEMARNGNTATLRADVQRAFDQCGIEHIMRATRDLQLSDELIHFAYLWYCIPCNARVRDASRKLRLTIEIMEGVRQGDAMSMALYGVGIEPVLAKARRDAGDDCVIINQADDILANAPPSAIAKAAYSIAANLPLMLGNTMSASKSSIFLPSDEMAVEMRQALSDEHDARVACPDGYDGPDLRDIKFSYDGFIVSGVPAGSSLYIEAEISKIVHAAATVTESILDCLNPANVGCASPLSVQGAVEAIRLGVLPRLNHVFRAIHPSETIMHALSLDARVDTALRLLHGMPFPTLQVTDTDSMTDESVIDTRVVDEMELSWQRMFVGRGIGLGFYKLARTAAAAFIGATALVAPRLHMAYGTRSQLNRADEDAHNLDSIKLHPIPPQYGAMMAGTIDWLKTKIPDAADGAERDDVKKFREALSRDAIYKACRDKKPRGKQQHVASRIIKEHDTAHMFDLIKWAREHHNNKEEPALSGMQVETFTTSNDIEFDGLLEDHDFTSFYNTIILDNMSPESAARQFSLANMRAFTLPTRDRRNRFSDREWVLAVRLALGIPILAEVQECPCCGARMSVTATHLLSCQQGRGMRKGAHDTINRQLALALRECAQVSDQQIPVVVTTDADEGGLKLHNDPAWMHGPRRAALGAVGGKFNAFAEDNNDDSNAEETDDDGVATDADATQPVSQKRARGDYNGSTAKKMRQAAARKRADATVMADLQADLRVMRCIDSPELNPVAARNNVETVDLKVTSPIGSSFLSGAAKKAGFAARLSERNKADKYKKQYEDGAGVAPLVIETFGYMSESSEHTLQRLVLLAAGLPKNTDLKTLHQASLVSSDAKKTYKRVRACFAIVRNAISTSLWRSNAVALDRKLREVNARAAILFAHPIAWEGPIFPKGVRAAFEEAMNTANEFRLGDNLMEGYRLEALA